MNPFCTQIASEDRGTASATKVLMYCCMYKMYILIKAGQRLKLFYPFAGIKQLDASVLSGLGHPTARWE
ncbi:hypothetical protein XELAEV_18003591mg [Xenopus laevis]|nr:hypothetical protein XELAEV_18003591mg [Xenopus laevis]